MLNAEIHADLNLDYSATESVNSICSNLTFAGKNVKRIVVTSCDANDGKSFMSMCILLNMAGRGKRTLLIDADLRASVLMNRYQIDLEGEKFGLAHVLSGQCTLEECVYQLNQPNAFLLPVGSDVTNPLSLISSKEFELVMQQLSTRFDLILVDAPPINVVIDAAEIARSCDGTIFVLTYNHTRVRALNQAKAQMESTGTPILGCIINKVTMDRLSTRKYYHYHYYHSHYNNYYKRYYKRDGKDKK